MKESPTWVIWVYKTFDLRLVGRGKVAGCRCLWSSHWLRIWHQYVVQGPLPQGRMVCSVRAIWGCFSGWTQANPPIGTRFSIINFSDPLKWWSNMVVILYGLSSGSAICQLNQSNLRLEWSMPYTPKMDICWGKQLKNHKPGGTPFWDRPTWPTFFQVWSLI